MTTKLHRASPFVGLGRRLSLTDIMSQVYLLAGASDDITPAAQVFGAERLLGTAPEQIRKETAQGRHIGLFMDRTVLAENWVRIAKWLQET